MMTSDEVKKGLKPQLAKLWDASSLAIDNPSEDTMEDFRSLCRPADVLLLLRVAAENNNPDRSEPFRVY